MFEIKYIVFFSALLFGVPINFRLAIKYPLYEKLLWFLMVFFTVYMIDINFVSMEWYRGTSKGFEIGMVDITVFSLLAVLIRRKKEFPLKRPPGSVLYFIYFFFSAISIINSDILIYSFFELWKMARMYLFFYVVYNMIRKLEDLDLIMLFISWNTIYITLIVLKQKYLLHIFQTPGPFPHQNSMVMYMIVFGSVLLAYALNKKANIMYWLPVFGAAAIDIISSFSRGGMAMFGGAVMIVFSLSHSHNINARKMGITILFIIGITGVLYKAMDSIIERVETAPEESKETRVVLAEAAVAMAGDYTLGIGLNNFAHKINPPYRYAEFLPMPDNEDIKIVNGLVETIYLMIAAETGWHNLAVFLIFLFYLYGKNIRNYFRLKGSEYRYFPLGLIGGLLAIYIQSTLEWVLKQTNNSYQLLFVFAIIGAISRMLDEGQYRYIKEE